MTTLKFATPKQRRHERIYLLLKASQRKAKQYDKTSVKKEDMRIKTITKRRIFNANMMSVLLCGSET